MTLLKIRAGPPEPIQLTLGAAAGASADDFLVLGYSPAFDDEESADHPEHEHNTFILQYAGGRRRIVAQLPMRVDDLWYSPGGPIYGVGESAGVLRIDAGVVTEVAIDNLPGSFSSIWGVGEAHVFACGNYDPFWLYRRAGTWHLLPLPPGVDGLWCVVGHHESDVYAVSGTGEILHFDGHQVRRLDSPTTLWLTAVAPMPGGRMCIGGYEGVLLYGDTNGWRSVDSGTDEPLLSLVPYQDGVCFVTVDGLWHFDAKQPPRLLLDHGARWLSRIGNCLILAGDEEAWLFDGRDLTSLDTML
jgi:hypothetical protein